MSTIVLAAILVVNGELTLHQARYDDLRSCRRAVDELRRASTLLVHHADCTPARKLGLSGRSGAKRPAPVGGSSCFTFDGREICG